MATRILILGGGFAGLATARALERLVRPGEADVTLVSRENFSLFTPMLPEVGSGNLETRHVVTPVRAQLRRTAFVLAAVTGVDLDARTVDIERTLLNVKATLTYDHLIFALGAVTSTFGLPGVEGRVLPYKTLADAERVRNHIIASLEAADVTTDARERARLLRFVFVGGGFTGVEAAGEMADFFRSSLHFYRSIRPAEVEVVLLEGADTLLPGLAPKMGAYSAKALAHRGIRVMTGTKVAAADDGGLVLQGGRRLDTGTIVWSAGVKPSPAVSHLRIASARGHAIAVERDFSVKGHAGVWAVGDCASIPAGGGKTYPQTAQHAIREGPRLARNVVARMRGRETKAFRYASLGIMASLGGRRAVAGLPGGIVLTGFSAWVLWRTYYLLRLPGRDRQLRVALDWTLGLVFPRDIAEMRTSDQPQALKGDAPCTL